MRDSSILRDKLFELDKLVSPIAKLNPASQRALGNFFKIESISFFNLSIK